MCEVAGIKGGICMLSVTMNSGVGTKGIGTLVCSDIHSKLPLESCENEFGMIPVIIWYEYHTSAFAVN